jgi:hypothetical protein
MNWYYIKEASEIAGKSERTLRHYLSRYRESNPNITKDNNIFRYEIVSNNIKKLQVSDIFLQSYFNVALKEVETPLKQPLQTIQNTPPENSETIKQELEQKYEQRLSNMQMYFDKQLDEIKQAKQQTIDLLTNQLDKADYQLNKVLEQYQMAQLTIQNLTTPQNNTLSLNQSIDDDQVSFEEHQDDVKEPEQTKTEQPKQYKQLDLEEEIDKIIQEKQQTKSENRLRPTKEYLEQEKPTGSNKSYADWLKALNKTK